MMRALDLWRKAEKADPRVGFTQIGWRRIESFLGTRIGARSRVVVLEDRVLRKVEICRGKGTKCAEMTEELDGLQLAAELQFNDISEDKIVASGKRQSLEGGIVQIGIGGSKTAHAQAHYGHGTVGHHVGVVCAHDRRRQTLAIGHVTAEGEVAVGEN